MAAWPSMRWVALAYRDDLVMGAYAERQMAETIVHAKIKMHGACATGVERPRRDTYTYSFGMRFPARTPHARRTTPRHRAISYTEAPCQCVYTDHSVRVTRRPHTDHRPACVSCSGAAPAVWCRAPARGGGGGGDPGPGAGERHDERVRDGSRSRLCGCVGPLFDFSQVCVARPEAESEIVNVIKAPYV